VYNRLPRFEDRTADEWVDEFAQRYRGVYVFDEVDAKEAELVFRSMGASAQSQLIKEFVQYRPLTGIQEWLVSVGWRLPPACRVGPFRDRKAPRRSVCRAVLGRIRPGWEVFKPAFEEFVERDDEKQLQAMFEALQYVGGNSEQVVPILIGSLTNSNWSIVTHSAHTLCGMGTNAASALPILLPQMALITDPSWEVDFLGNLGSMAISAIPLLERWFDLETAPMPLKRLAIAILKIDPSHQGAEEYLESLLSRHVESDRKDNFYYEFYDSHQVAYSPKPNPALARMIQRALALGVRDGVEALYWQYDPIAARSHAMAELSKGDAAFTSVHLMLKGDPTDQIALDFVKDRFGRPFPLDEIAPSTWLEVLWHCRSDSPMIAEILERATALIGEELQEGEIMLARRHIELNDRLWQLRNKPPVDKGRAIGL